MFGYHKRGVMLQIGSYPSLMVQLSPQTYFNMEENGTTTMSWGGRQMYPPYK